MAGKVALIIGCHGQDGSLISRSLLRKGYEVIGLSRSENHTNRTHEKLGIDKDIKIETGDITNITSMTKIFEDSHPDEIYNLAGQSSVGLSFKDPISTIQSIVNGTLNLLEIAKNNDYKGSIFFAGSSEVFGNTEKKADIFHKQRPRSPYAIGKQTSYNLVKLYRDIYGLKCMTGILFNHESPFRNRNFVTQKIISGIIHCSKNKKHIIRIGNLNIKRDWGWAEEYVEAMQLMATSNTSKDQVICTGQLNSLRQFIEIGFKKMNLNIHNHLISDEKLFRPIDIDNSYGDPELIKKELNWEAKVRLEKIIENLLEYKLKTTSHD